MIRLGQYQTANAPQLLSGRSRAAQRGVGGRHAGRDRGLDRAGQARDDPVASQQDVRGSRRDPWPARLETGVLNRRGAALDDRAPAQGARAVTITP